MARHREEARLGAVRRIGLVARVRQRPFALGAIGDVAADALHLRRAAGVVAHQALAPGDPARTQRPLDLLVVNPRAVRFQRGVALFENLQRAAATDQRVARLSRQFAIGVVGKGDAAVGVAQHDQVALCLEQAAGPLLGFLQLPIAIGHGFVVHDDLAHFSPHQPQSDAQRRQRHAGDREHEAGADRKRVRIVAGDLRTAAGNETVGAAKCGGEDHERADGEGDPGMASCKAAEEKLDPVEPRHRQ